MRINKYAFLSGDKKIFKRQYLFTIHLFNA